MRKTLKLTFKKPKPTDGLPYTTFIALMKGLALTIKIVKFKTGVGRSYTYSYRYYDEPTNCFFIRPIRSTTLHVINLNTNKHEVVHKNVPFVSEFKQEVANYLYPKREDKSFTDQDKLTQYNNHWSKKNTRIDRRKPHTIKYFKGQEPMMGKHNFIMGQVRDFNQV